MPVTPRPCRGLVPAAPPSIMSHLAPPPVLCAPIKGLHRAPVHTRPSTTIAVPVAPPLDLAVEPHFPLLLHPNRCFKQVTLDLLVLLDSTTPPSPSPDRRRPPPTSRKNSCSPPAAQLRPPHRAHQLVSLDLLMLPHPFSLAAD
jgi:hypothetical protein